MEIIQGDLNRLANAIRKYIYEEFELKHLSGNLMNTMEVVVDPGSIKIIIPALKYNMSLYQQKGVVVPNGRGSYASVLDEKGSEFFIYPNPGRKGSFKIKPHNHIGYVERAINKALQEWTANNNYVITSRVG